MRDEPVDGLRALIWSAAFLVLAAATLLMLALRDHLGEAHVALVFLLVVLGASAAGGKTRRNRSGPLPAFNGNIPISPIVPMERRPAMEDHDQRFKHMLRENSKKSWLPFLFQREKRILFSIKMNIRVKHL